MQNSAELRGSQSCFRTGIIPTEVVEEHGNQEWIKAMSILEGRR
jgi:hypothetical protein